MDIVAGYLLEKCNSKMVDLNYVKEHLDELAIKCICIDEYTLLGDKKVIYTDLEHPLIVAKVIFGGNKTLCIDSTFYNDYQKEINDLVAFICQNNKAEEIAISSSILINKEILKLIASNPHIKSVNLGDRTDVVYLNKEMYEILNNGNISNITTYGVDDDLKENFDPIISYNHRNLVTNYNYDELSNDSIFFISKSLNEESLYYLKYLNKQAKVQLDSNDYDNIFKIINRLKECGFKGDIIIDIDKKNPFNEYLFSHLDSLKDTRGIRVNSLAIDGLYVDLISYIKYEKTLIDMVLPAMNLSPFEKYIYMLIIKLNNLKNTKKVKIKLRPEIYICY